jgi:16S rRNA pseudouridine516 synthase
VYRVTLANPITEEYIAAFAEGMYFGFEDITTQPAKLVILADNVAEVTLHEGKYHQIKRMFGRFRNPVVGLHRLSIGDIVLDEKLAPGESRALTAAEVASIR